MLEFLRQSHVRNHLAKLYLLDNGKSLLNLHRQVFLAQLMLSARFLYDLRIVVGKVEFLDLSWRLPVSWLRLDGTRCDEGHRSRNRNRNQRDMPRFLVWRSQTRACPARSHYCAFDDDAVWSSVDLAPADVTVQNAPRPRRMSYVHA